MGLLEIQTFLEITTITKAILAFLFYFLWYLCIKIGMKKVYIKRGFDDIKALYPNQWVGLADFEMEGLQIKSAYLLCVGKSKMDATKQLSKLIAHTDFENYSVG